MAASYDSSVCSGRCALAPRCAMTTGEEGDGITTKKTVQLHRNTRRAQIVVLGEHGYGQTSFARIAKEAGLSGTRLISYHFAGKDGARLYAPLREQEPPHPAVTQNA